MDLELAGKETGQGLADQEWSSYLDRLAQMTGVGLTSVGGIAGVNRDQSNIISGMGENIGKGYQKGYQDDETANNQGSKNLLSAIMGGANLLTGLFK